MSSVLKMLIHAATGISLLAVGFALHAQTLEELIGSDKLRIKSWIEPSENIIARQQINLYIEIATDKWFSGGTRIGRIEMDDAIVLQREQFAVNSTRSDGGKSRTVQLWTLVIYPQRGGTFEIPAIPLHLALAGESQHSVIGKMNTDPLNFTARIPDALQDKTNWVATTRFEVKESFNKSLEDLKPGDALIRTINMSASDLPAMMLPEFKSGNFPGIAIYQKPPDVTDRVNRGDYLATRTEVMTYVFEHSGDYQLPAQTFYWWDLRSQRVESIVLPRHTLKIGISSAADSNGSDSLATGQKEVINLTLLLKYTGIAFIILLAIWIFARKLNRTSVHNRLLHSSLPTEKALRRQFEEACAQNNPDRAISLLYKWLDNYGGDRFQGSVRQHLSKSNHVQLATIFDNVMRSIYTEDDDNKVDLQQFSSKTVKQMKMLKRPHNYNRWAIDIKLN